MNLEQFAKERDEALLSLDEKRIRTYLRKYHVEFHPSNETVFWADVHKTIIGIRSATAEQKAQSAKWLIEHGFKPGIS